MKKIFITIVILFVSVISGVTQPIGLGTYELEETLVVQFEKIENQVRLEVEALRKQIELDASGEYYGDLPAKVADYRIETMLIDSILSRKLDIIEVNPDFAFVICEAIDEYDKLLNKYYKLVMNAIPEDAAIKLRNSQRAWLSLRDTNVEFQKVIYFKYRYFGRLGQVITYNMIFLDMYRLRVAELFEYYLEFNDFTY